MRLRLEQQRNPVADEVAALTSVVLPILEATLYSLKQDVVRQVGGYGRITLDLLTRLYVPGDGDCGICFEWAVHDAITRRDPMVMERVQEALKECRVPRGATKSILFGAEKSGSLQIIDTARDLLTDNSALYTGVRGRPIKIKRYFDTVVASLRRPQSRDTLPQSIQGLWKTDLFVGDESADVWVATTVKINPNQLEGAKGLRIGIVPNKQGMDDRVRYESGKNLVICPLNHDASFMEVFYNGWSIVQQIIHSKADMPKEINLFRAPERQVARCLVDRRSFPVLDIVEALRPLCQPELLESKSVEASNITVKGVSDSNMESVLSPVSRIIY